MQRKIQEETDLYSPFGRYADTDSEETNERNVNDIIVLCASMDMVCRKAEYNQNADVPHL